MTDFERRLCDVLLKGAAMRDAQSDYFHQRTKAALIAAKQLEREFDKSIAPTLAEARQRGWSPT